MTTHKNRQLGQKIMKLVKDPMILGKRGMPQYATMNKQRYKMPQNYCTLKYVHPSCNENFQPQIGNAKQDHVS